MDKFIDNVFYINLDERTDRKNDIEAELARYNIVNYERIQATKTIPGFIGCGVSHINALKKAKERGYKNILIMEDDFYFTVSPKILYENISAFFQSNISFDVCFLSYNILSSEDLKDNPIVSKVLDSATASGYIVNSTYFDTLIELFTLSVANLIQTHQHWNYSIDRVWNSIQAKDNWFYFKTRLGKQRQSFSNIGNREVNYIDC